MNKNDEKFIFINIYNANVEKDQIEVLNKLNKKLSNIEDILDYNIVCGDWNFYTLGKKCRKIAGILPENFCVPFRSVFYPFLEKKTGIARMESGKKKIRFFSVFFPDCVF